MNGICIILRLKAKSSNIVRDDSLRSTQGDHNPPEGPKPTRRGGGGLPRLRSPQRDHNPPEDPKPTGGGALPPFRGGRGGGDESWNIYIYIYIYIKKI